ncbi:MAG: hypothetical protein ACOX2D_14130 [Fermentimonas sp.]|jgi:hypothetical protein
MRYISTIFATFMLLLLTGCADSHFVPEQNVNNEYTIVVSARMPSDNNVSSRVSLEKSSESLALIAKWSENDKIKMFFAQEGNVFEGEEATLYDISQDGKRCSFNITVPQSVNVYAPFDLYGFCGIQGLGVCINNGKILADVTPIECREIAQLSAPVWFNASVREISKEISADFSHLGSYEVIHVQNNSSEEVDMSKCRLAPFGNDAVKWYHSRSEGYRPFFNPVTKEVEDLQAQHSAPGNHTLKIAAGQSKAIVSWYVPKAVNIPEFQLQLDDKLSVNTKPAKDFGMRAGRAYYVFGVWDGQHLTITDDDFSLPEGFDPTMAAIIKVHEAIDPIASEALLSDNPEEELKKVAEQFKDNPEIATIEFDRDKLALKYKNGGWVFWLMIPEFLESSKETMGFRSNSTWELKSDFGANQYPKILVLDHLRNNGASRWHDGQQFLTSAESDLKIDSVVNACKNKGFNVNYVSGSQMSLSFFTSELKNYDAIFINTHGSFKTEKKGSGLTWLATGEIINEELFDRIEEWKNDEISVMGCREKDKNGEWQTKRFFSISQIFLARNYRYGDFNNSFIYLGACQGMMDENDGLSKVFVIKGAKKIVGYNNTIWQYVGIANWVSIMDGLLSGKSYNDIYESSKLKKKHYVFFGGEELYPDLVSYPADTDFRFKILKLNTTWIKLSVGDERTVEISGGSGNYSISNNNDNVVLASLLDSIITLKGVFNGKAVITVTDNETKRTETITVTVPSIGGSGSVVDVPGRDL